MYRQTKVEEETEGPRPKLHNPSVVKTNGTMHFKAGPSGRPHQGTKHSAPDTGVVASFTVPLHILRTGSLWGTGRKWGQFVTSLNLSRLHWKRDVHEEMTGYCLGRNPSLKNRASEIKALEVPPGCGDLTPPPWLPRALAARWWQPPKERLSILTEGSRYFPPVGTETFEVSE